MQLEVPQNDSLEQKFESNFIKLIEQRLVEKTDERQRILKIDLVNCKQIFPFIHSNEKREK